MASSKACPEMAEFRLGANDFLKRSGMSQNQLAKRINWTSGQISVFLSIDTREKAEADAKVGTCAAIAEAFEVSMVEIFDRGKELLPAAIERWEHEASEVAA